MSSGLAPPVFIRDVRSISGGGGTFDGSHTLRNVMVLTRRPPTDDASQGGIGPGDAVAAPEGRYSTFI